MLSLNDICCICCLVRQLFHYHGQTLDIKGGREML